MPTNSDPNFSSKSNPENGLIEVAKTIGLSLVLALGIRQFVAEARYIPTESMLPTLEVNDRLIIEKIGYRFSSPQRGDIVVFTPPDAAGRECMGIQDPNFHIKDAFIKRVVALPGETIEVKEGTVFINNQPLAENYIVAKVSRPMPSTVVPADAFMVLGDNRNNSCDSRFWGAVPRENIIGRATFRFWPPNRLGTLGTTSTPGNVSSPEAMQPQPSQSQPSQPQPIESQPIESQPIEPQPLQTPVQPAIQPPQS